MAMSYRFLQEVNNTKDALEKVRELIPLLEDALIDEAYDSQSTRAGGIGGEAALTGFPISDELKRMYDEIDAKKEKIRRDISDIESNLESMENAL